MGGGGGGGGAWPGLLVKKHSNLTPPSQGVTGLHYTAALYLKIGFVLSNLGF